MKIAQIFLCLLLLIAIVNACISNAGCSGHGSCVNRVCNCNAGYTGDDCSIVIVSVSSGEVVTNSVEDRSWVYYTISTTDGEDSLIFAVTQSTLVSDCDLYVQKDSFPSKSDYTAKDSTRNQNFNITIESPGTHTWYAGMYGFYSCQFSMTTTILVQPSCPNSCSGHGICQTGNVCQCNSGYTGSDCSTAITQLPVNTPNTYYVNQYQWNYYYYNSVAQDGIVPQFTVIVNQTISGEGDSDLYISYNQLPSLFSYDYREASIVENYALSVGSPEVGTYYIGIYGYRACSYLLTLKTVLVSNCEDLCSNHGTCVNNVCHCNGPFNGTKCETMTQALQEGVSVSGYVENNQWNYYFADTQTSNNMIINIKQVGSGDCDVYVRAGQNPTKTSYDYRDIGFSTSFNITVLNPLGSVWYIGVYGYRSCNYMITEYISKNSCPNDCSGNGNCVSGGRCSCNSGYAGVDCASPLHRIHSGEVISDSVTQNRYVYYKYTAPNAPTSITVELLETNSNGYIWLYLSHIAPPTQSSNDYSDTTSEAVHVIHFEITESSTNQDYYIGVYGNAYLPLMIDADYQIVVYSPSLSN